MHYEAELNAIGEETVTFGVDSGAELTVIGQATATGYPKNGHQIVKAMRDCTGKPVEDLGSKNLVLNCCALTPSHIACVRRPPAM